MNCPKCGTNLDVTKVKLAHGRVNFDKNEVYLEETRECPKCHAVLAAGKKEIEAFMRGKPTSKMASRYAEMALEGG